MYQTLIKGLKHAGMCAAAAVALVSCVTPAKAEPDYNSIGRQFSLIMQNAHFSQTRFSSALYKKFLEQYLQMQDPQRLFFTQQDVDALMNKYGVEFGDFLIANQTVTLARELNAMYTERATHYLDYAEKLLNSYNGKLPSFDSDRSVERSRRKVDRAADEAALEQVWHDQVENMLLSEQIRRDNLAKLAAEKGKSDPSAKDVSVIEKVRSRIKRRRSEVQEADLEDMVTDVLNAVAASYDPHSDYMGARAEQRFKDMMGASIVGIGARLKADDDGSTTVEGIVKGGPAAKCGQIALGDHIIAVDRNGDGQWTDIMYMSIDKVVDLIRGKMGSTVKLRIISENSSEEKEVMIRRDEVPMSEELASARIIDMKRGDATYRLGILTLPAFYVDLDGNGAHCAADVKRILRRMVKEGVQGIVIDLRFNGGGSLDEVRKMVGYFIGSGPVVQVMNNRHQVDRLQVSGNRIFDGKLVVLCNKFSASASEIFAGAMADYGRALIVGDERTFGKGTVQVPRSLADFLPLVSNREGAGMIKYTIQQFYRVCGASTQMKGVASDIVLPSVTTGIKYGECDLDNALPFHELPKAPNYVRDTRLDALIPSLRQASEKRVNQDLDMCYLREDADRSLKQQEENRLSLNKKAREDENAKLLERKKSIDAERAARYAQLAESDARDMVIYRLYLEDVAKSKLPLYNPSEDKKSFMDEVKDPDDELADSPDYPSGLDPLLRESLNIVSDMVSSY